MTSLRLRPDQVAKLRALGNGAAVIRHAVMRYRRGDFAIHSAPPKRERANVLRTYPIRRKPDGLADWQIREILDRHFAVKDRENQARLAREIEEIELEIAEIIAKLWVKANGGYLLEEDEDA